LKLPATATDFAPSAITTNSTPVSGRYPRAQKSLPQNVSLGSWIFSPLQFVWVFFKTVASSAIATSVWAPKHKKHDWCSKSTTAQFSVVVACHQRAAEPA
jgi:hypothetical protein